MSDPIYIYAFDEHRVYYVAEETDGWYRCNVLGRRAMSGAYDRAFIKRGSDHFRIVPEELAYMLMEKTPRGILEFFVDREIARLKGEDHDAR